MRDRLPIIGFALALLVGVLAVLMLRASSRGEFAEDFSTYKSEPDGARALFLLAQQAGLPVARRHVDFEAIEGTPELVLLGIEGDVPEKDGEPDGGVARDRWERGRLGKYETEALLEAVDRGGTLIYAVTRDHPFLGDLGITFTPAEDHLSRVITPFSPTPLTEGVHTLQGRISGYLAPSQAVAAAPIDNKKDKKPKKAKQAPVAAAAVDALPVLIDRHHGDQAVALLIRRGAGRILVVSAPTLAANREIAQDDAARFWLNALTDLQPRNGGIEFDEYHHGFTGERSIMGYASRYGLQWAIAQGIFALGLWSFALRRFGQVQESVEETQRAGADYLLAMARIYRLGGHRGHAAQALVRGALRSLQGLTPLGRRGDVAQVAASLDAMGQNELAHELRAIDARARSGDLDDAALLSLARRAAHLRARAAGTVPSPPSPGENAS